jgi:heme o synthase
LKEKLKILAELFKLRITIFVALTTLFGFIYATGGVYSSAFLPIFGVLLLASGSAVINHWQERRTDALMDRTKNRPIPSGRISADSALAIAVVLVISGLAVLLLGSGWIPFTLGLLNLIWYNAIYTPLKLINPLAIIPGSLVGAIPPMIGWTAAGGYVLEPQILIIAFFFFIWQIPHFWLLLLVFDEDYIKAGFPTLTQIFERDQLSRITFIWTIATIVTGLLIPLFGVVNSGFINIGLFITAVWFSISAVKLLKPAQAKMNFRFAFKEINYFVVIVVVLLSIDKLVILY